MLPFVKTIHARGVLSFAPDSEPLPLTPLNVLIGPNGSGKSNLIEIFELLKAAPTGLSEALRDGGGISEWLWKGEAANVSAAIAAELRIQDVKPVGKVPRTSLGSAPYSRPVSTTPSKKRLTFLTPGNPFFRSERTPGSTLS